MKRCPHAEPPRPIRVCVLPAEHLGPHQYPVDLLSEPVLAEALKGEAWVRIPVRMTCCDG